MERVIALADALENTEFGDILSVGWAFFMRMRSECFYLMKGNPDQLFCLQSGQHFAVVIDNLVQPPVIRIRWRQRKHRPAGSMLTRGCECLMRCGPGDQSRPDLCVVHRLEKRLSSIPVGGMLFTMDATQALKTLKKYEGC